MKIILLLFAIILCIYSTHTTAEVRTFTHNEELAGSYGPDATLRLWDSKAYDDGTVIVRILRRKTKTNTSVCMIEKLFLRIVNLDGTVVEKDIGLDIQPFNWCVYANPNPQGLKADPTFELFDYQLIRKNQILITYFNATNPDNFNDASTQQWGMIIDLDGNVLSRAYLGQAFIDPVSKAVIPNSAITLNINREKGFLRITTISGSRNLEWQQYKVELDGTITSLTTGIIELPEFKSSATTPFATIDEGYAIAYSITNATSSTTEDPLSARGQLVALFIGYNQTATSPLLLYQTPLPNLIIPTVICDVARVGVGQICSITVLQRDPTGALPDKVFYIMISFLSSGSVSSFKVNTDFQIPPNRVPNSIVNWNLQNLPFGGFLATANIQDQNQLFNFGYLLDENSVKYPWELKEPEPTGVHRVLTILPNNTLLVSQPDPVDNSFWRLNVIDLPKFSPREDKGYYNLNVAGTSPNIQSSINPDIPNISIDFYDPVDLSDGKLSIYYMEGGKRYLRQSIPASSCSLSNDGRTVIANILGSTFSVTNGSYFVQVDNNFVESRAFKEPLLGIRENVWKFTTTQKLDKFAPETDGLLRLTVNGTQAFDNLSQEQRDDFFNNLLKDLSYAIPVPMSRLTTNRKAQLDSNKQYLISVNIKDSKNENDLSVETILKNLDIMIKNKEQTPIGLMSQVSGDFLDKSYGFQASPNLWEKYRLRLLALFLVVGFVIVLFLFAQRRDPKGNNIAILQLGVILFDLIMDILFVSNNGRDVPVLYIPSVVFVTVPIGINTVLAFLIITKENTRGKFYEWFAAHGKVASVFTVLSGADIEALNILQSGLAGFPFFQAPFSDEAKSKIFWGACVNIFTEDIPQVIIQILYRYYTVAYDIIPLLTLISSIVNLTVNIVGRLYQGTIRVRNGGTSRDISNDTDDFGDLNTVISTSDQGDINNERKDLVGDPSTSREIPPQNYLGDVLKLNNTEDKLGLGAMLGDSNNILRNNSSNKSKGMTFLKRMVSRKE